MTKWLIRLALVGVIAAAGMWVWRAWFPSPETAIRLRLNRLACLASFGPNEGDLARPLNSQKLAGFFTEDVQIRIEYAGAAHTLEGRENIRNAAFNARSLYTGLTVDFPDIAIEVMPDTVTAEAALTARARAAGDRDAQFYELKFILKKIGGDWLIRRIETARTLK